MVDVTFKERAAHFVPLALLRRIAAETSDPPEDVAYIGAESVAAIKGTSSSLAIYAPRSYIISRQTWHS